MKGNFRTAKAMVINMKTDFFDTVKKELVFYRDCTQPLGLPDTFEVGDSCIVDSPIGRYRENAARDNSRFGYSFVLRTTEKPHLIELVYPDDKPRSICVQDGTSYDLTMGIITGSDCPITKSMQKAYNIFWPRALDQSLLISSLSGAEPAAAASIAVYELESLPDAGIESDLSAGTDGIAQRTIGIQYEDPCNVGASEGAMEFDTWLAHHMEYMRASGQNRLVYPINWYHGPIIPVKSQPASRFNTVIHPTERRQYSRHAFTFPDWLDGLLSKFDREGFHFTGSLTLLRLGNLMEHMNIDQDAINAGAPTYNNILYDGTVQTSTNDWTLIYNPKNYPQAVAMGVDNGAMQYAYGEHRTQNHLYAPIFNPIHPEVRCQVMEYFEEIVTRYAHHPSFEGLSVNFWHATILWFGDLLTGYDDVTAALFSAETGLVIPAENGDPERFSKRYRWLMENAREEWIDWRCHKVCDFLCELSRHIRAVREDLTLTVSIWNETSVCGYFPAREGFPSPGSAGTQYGAGVSLYEIYRMGGIDLALLENVPGIKLSVERNFCRNAAARSGQEVYSRHLTDPMRLDEELFSHLRTADNTEGFHFNCWEERWGKHSWFACEEDDAPITDEIKAFPDYRAEFIFRLNSAYDDEDKGPFFYPNQSRIMSLFPADRYYSEWLGMDLALHDALSVTFGGLYLDKQHLPETLAFAEEYRRLPAKKFTDLPGMTDPVVMRYLQEDNRIWVYALNREPYEIPVTFVLNGEKYTWTLPPFGLRSVVGDGSHLPQEIAYTVDETVIVQYEEETKHVLYALSQIPADTDACVRCGCEHIAARIAAAWEAKQFAALRHLLQSYFALYVKSINGKENEI